MGVYVGVGVQSTMATLPMDIQSVFSKLEQTFQFSSESNPQCGSFPSAPADTWQAIDSDEGAPGSLHVLPGQVFAVMTKHGHFFPGSINELTEEAFINVTTHSTHVSALDSQGRVYMWGNYVGFEHAHLTQRPTLLTSLSGIHVIQVVGSGLFSLFLSDAGTVYGIGDFDHVINSNTVVEVKLLSGYFITQMACSEDHALFCTDTHDLLSVGSNIHGQLGVSEAPSTRDNVLHVKKLAGIPLRKISCGWAHSAAVSQAGRLYSWGGGFSTHISVTGFPSAAPILEPTFLSVSESSRILDVSCGLDHTLVLTEEGYVYTFGSGAAGRLGHGDEKDQAEPCRVAQLGGIVPGSMSGRDNDPVVAICTGPSLSGCITQAGLVFTWGSEEKELASEGPPLLQPVALTLPSHVTQKFTHMTLGSTETRGYLITGTPRALTLAGPPSSQSSAQAVKEFNKRFLGFSETEVFERLSNPVETVTGEGGCLLILAWLWRLAGQQSVLTESSRVAHTHGQDHPFTGAHQLKVLVFPYFRINLITLVTFITNPDK